MKKVFIITGQTATGKTKYALELAKKYNGELVNCDSRQIYKHLDIITGKDIPKNAKLKTVKKINSFNIGYYFIQNTKIWLYDIVDPKQSFSSFDYTTCAVPVIKDILKRKKVPIIIGGTYLYIYHLLYNVETQNIPPNWDLRQKLNNKKVEELQKILISKNEKLFSQLNNSDRNNPQRLIRKIEISLSNLKINNKFKYQQPISLGQKINQSNLKITFLGLKNKSRKNADLAIRKRVEERVNNHAIDEVKKLLNDNYSEKDPGLKTIGYQQIIKFINNEITKEKMIEEWINKEIQYAKRQITFMKNDPKIVWKII